MGTLHRTQYGLMAALILSVVWTAAVWAADPGARILSVQGVVEVQSASPGRWTDASPAGLILPGDAIRTGAQSSAVLQIDGARMTLRETTLLRIPASATTVSTTPHALFRHPWLEAGRALFEVTPQHPARPFSVSTPTLVAGVKGTVFEVIATGTEQAVYVWEGLVEVTSTLDPLDVHLVGEAEYTMLDHLRLTPSSPIPSEREQPVYEQRVPAKEPPTPAQRLILDQSLTASPMPDTLTDARHDADRAAIGMVMESMTDFQTIVSRGELRAPAPVHRGSPPVGTTPGAAGPRPATSLTPPVGTTTAPGTSIVDTVPPISGVTPTLTHPISGVVRTVTDPIGALGF